MPDSSKPPMVRGASQAAKMFRCEVARELGIELPNDEHKSYKRLKTTAIQGRLAQRMVELAEQQMRQTGRST